MSGPDPRDTAEGEGERHARRRARAHARVRRREAARALRLPSAGTTPGTSDASESETFAKSKTLVVPAAPRARAVERELDAAAVSEREARMRRLETRAAEIDAAVADPRTRWRLEG